MVPQQLGDLPGALDLLLGLEKQVRTVRCTTAPPAQNVRRVGDQKLTSACARHFTRAGAQAADLNSSIRVLIAIVRLCFESNDWTALNENIVLLMKKRGQMKQVRRRRLRRRTPRWRA